MRLTPRDGGWVHWAGSEGSGRNRGARILGLAEQNEKTGSGRFAGSRMTAVGSRMTHPRSGAAHPRQGCGPRAQRFHQARYGGKEDRKRVRDDPEP